MRKLKLAEVMSMLNEITKVATELSILAKKLGVE